MAQVGKLVADLLADPRRAAEMRYAQREFRQGADIARIARFALDESFIPTRQILTFGFENGTGALNLGL